MEYAGELNVMQVACVYKYEANWNLVQLLIKAWWIGGKASRSLRITSSIAVSDLSTDVHLRFDHILDEQAWDVHEVLWQDHIPNICTADTSPIDHSISLPNPESND